MNLISLLHQQLERSCAGSDATAQRVISMLGGAKKTFYFGDESVTPALLAKAGFDVTAFVTESSRVKEGCSFTQSFQPPDVCDGYGLIWYNGVVEFDPPTVRLEQLKSSCAKGTYVVFRALCWLIDPSPDTLSYCNGRYGVITPLDRLLLCAKQCGFTAEDFYISPKTDWTEGYFAPLRNAAQQLAGTENSSGHTAELGALEKEENMFRLHCEEYSYVYYILKG
ncbi:MAG: hypothetical protein ACI4KA_06015 [Oscillospiraceae bacterium]